MVLLPVKPHKHFCWQMLCLLLLKFGPNKISLAKCTSWQCLLNCSLQKKVLFPNSLTLRKPQKKVDCFICYFVMNIENEPLIEIIAYTIFIPLCFHCLNLNVSFMWNLWRDDLPSRSKIHFYSLNFIQHKWNTTIFILWRSITNIPSNCQQSTFLRLQKQDIIQELTRYMLWWTLISRRLFLLRVT